MGLKRFFKKAGKLAKKSLKFQGKLITAPLKFAKKNPALTAAIVGGVASGGLLSFGKKLAGGFLKKKGFIPTDVASGGEAGPGLETLSTPFFGPEGPSPEQVGEGVVGGEFAPPIPKTALLVGGAALAALLLLKGKK
jgi:hypothetical protein